MIAILYCVLSWSGDHVSVGGGLVVVVVAVVVEYLHICITTVLPLMI